MPFLGSERRQHVGMDKYKIVHHDFNHFTLGPALKGRPATKMAFTLSEPEKLNNAFNVLHVRTQQPTILRMPLVRLLLDTWAETVELVRPVFRLGVPESSLKDKCKWWSDDDAALPTTPSLKTQRLLKAMANESFGAARHNHQHLNPNNLQSLHPTQQQQEPQPSQAGTPSLVRPPTALQTGPAAVSAAEGSVSPGQGPHLQAPGGHVPAHGHGHGHSGRRHLTPFQKKEELVEAVTPWIVLGLNVAAWCYLGASANKPAPGM